MSLRAVVDWRKTREERYLCQCIATPMTSVIPKRRSKPLPAQYCVLALDDAGFDGITCQ
jgi:hypothetical protein